MSQPSQTRSRGSTASSLMQDLPGAFPESSSPVASNQHSLSQAIYARRAEYTRPKNIKIKVGTWNTASCKGTEKDVGDWFVGGKGVAHGLTGLHVSSPTEQHNDTIENPDALNGREDVNSQESRYVRKMPTLPQNDPGSVPGGDEIGLYCLGLQEVVDINSASEALRPYTDPSAAAKWKTAMANALPPGYRLVAEQQLIGLLLLIYASEEVASEIKSVSTTSVGTGLMGYMGNKGAVTARLVLGETTRLVFVNCHMAAGVDKGSLERRNWDFQQIVSRTKFDPIQDSMDLVQNTGEQIGDEDVAFWVGDLNYRLEGIPGDDVRRLLMLHTRNEYDLSKPSSHKIQVEIAKDQASSSRRSRARSSTASTGSTTSTIDSTQSAAMPDLSTFSSNTLSDEDGLDPASDPASLQTTLASLLPHDELVQVQKAGKAFHNGWKEGPITFLPTYKYDPGSVGVFDSSEKRRAPSWCDRILYRTRREMLAYDSMVSEQADARLKDAEMKKNGLDEAAKDEELLYDYDPDTDHADDNVSDSESAEHNPDVVITKEGFKDELHLEYYTAHQRVLSSDHKPLDAVFHLKYDAVVPELKARVHQDIARSLDRAENDSRPSVTVVVDRHHHDDTETNDDDPARFEGVWYGSLRYAQHRHRSLTIANTGRVPATFAFIDRPVGPGQAAGAAPSWLSVRLDGQSLSHSATDLIGGSPALGKRHLNPGEACNIDLDVRILDVGVVKDLNEGIRQLEDILVLRVENGRDHFIPVRAKWLESTLGRSINKLIRIPEGGIRKLQHQKPDSSKMRDLSFEDLPVKWSAPPTLFRLTEAAEALIERSTAEWSMTSDDGKPPWVTIPGWPFSEESWSASTIDHRHMQMSAITDALDADMPVEASFPPDTTPLQQLEGVAATLLEFLRSMPDGIITEQLWENVESEMVKHQRESLTVDEQRSFVQETLTQSPAHNISFILIVSMLNRAVREIENASVQYRTMQPEPDPPRSPNPLALLMRRDTSKDSAISQRRINARALASLFADAMIRTNIAGKEKERTAREERKIKVIEMFIT